MRAVTFVSGVRRPATPASTAPTWTHAAELDLRANRGAAKHPTAYGFHHRRPPDRPEGPRPAPRRGAGSRRVRRGGGRARSPHWVRAISSRRRAPRPDTPEQHWRLAEQ